MSIDVVSVVEDEFLRMDGDGGGGRGGDGGMRNIACEDDRGMGAHRLRCVLM